MIPPRCQRICGRPKGRFTVCFPDAQEVARSAMLKAAS
jgi:hypothetical protein